MNRMEIERTATLGQNYRMNTKQFVSSLLFHGVDWGVSRCPLIGPALALPLRITFPTMAYERFGRYAMRRSIFLSVYLAGFLICFGLQALLAHQAGFLGVLDSSFGAQPDPAGGPDRVMFLDDAQNLFNYVVLVPFYLVAGTGFMISLFSLKDRMAPAHGHVGFALDYSIRPLLSGVGAVGAFVTIVVLSQAGYANDLHRNAVQLFWFHGATIDGAFGYNGYAYLVVNTFLASFVILVALLHLEMFRWSSILARGIRQYAAERDKIGIFVGNGDRLKELFSPFTETAIWSKAFAMILAVNIYTWRVSGVSGDSHAAELDANSWFFRLIVLVYVVIALWLVSLPRYRIQYEIFRLRGRNGVHDYFDIRMPWTIGWSVFIDLMLLTFFSTALLGNAEIFDLIASLFEG